MPPPLCLRGTPLTRAQVWSLKDLAGPEVVMSNADTFPGPASSAPLDEVTKYVAGRAAGGGGLEGEDGEGERLLWGVAGLALQFKVIRRTMF